MLWWLAQSALIAAVLAGAVALLCKVTRLGPAARHMLWLVVLLRLLAPPFVHWPWPAPDPFRRWGRATPAPEKAPRSTVRLAEVFEGRLECIAVPESRGADAPFVPLPRTGGDRPSLSDAQPASVSFAGPGPESVLLALWPAPLEARLGPRGCRGVIAHELAHLRRRDHWVAWLESLAGCLWWWNPIYWYVRHRLRESAELACDAWVVSTLPGDRRAYAEALLEASREGGRARAPASVMGWSAGARRQFERRLVMVMRGHAPYKVPLGGLVGIGLLALAVLPAWSRGQGADGVPSRARLGSGFARPRISGPAEETGRSVPSPAASVTREVPPRAALESPPSGPIFYGRSYRLSRDKAQALAAFLREHVLRKDGSGEVRHVNLGGERSDHVFIVATESAHERIAAFISLLGHEDAKKGPGERRRGDAGPRTEPGTSR